MVESRKTSRGKTGRAWLVLVVVLVIGGAIFGGLEWQRNTEEEARQRRQNVAVQAWANLQQCVFGAPLGTIDDLARRARLIELAEGHASDGDPWPFHCARHAAELYEAIADPGRAGTLEAQLADRFGCDEACVIDQPAVQFQGLDELVKGAGLSVVAATVAGPPLLEHELLQKEKIAPLSPWNATIKGHDVLEDGTIRLLFSSQAQGLQLCELHPDEGGASCDPVPIEGALTGLELQTGGALAVVSRAARGGRGRSYYRADTGAEVKVYGGVFRGTTLMDTDDQEYELADVRDGQARRKVKLKLPTGSSTPWRMAGHLAWLEESGTEGATLQLRKLEKTGELLGTKQKVAAGPARREPSAVCHSGTSAVARFGSAARPEAMVFYDGARWSNAVTVGKLLAPVEADGSGGDDFPLVDPAGSARPTSRAPRRHQDASEFGIIGLLGSSTPVSEEAPSPWGKVPNGPSPLWKKPKALGPKSPKALPLRRRRARPGLPTHSFSCRDGEATVTWRQPRPASDTIHQLRCTPTDCRRTEATIEGLGVKVWWLATALGEHTLLVWRARGGELRMRLAPLADLPETKDVVLMDSADHGGPATVDLQAFVGSSAVVFMFRDVGHQGLRVDEDGQVGSLL